MDVAEVGMGVDTPFAARRQVKVVNTDQAEGPVQNAVPKQIGIDTNCRSGVANLNKLLTHFGSLSITTAKSRLLEFPHG